MMISNCGTRLAALVRTHLPELARTRLLVVVAVLVGALPAQGQTPLWDDVLQQFGRQLASDVQTDGIGGIVAGVAVDGDLVWARGFGYADRNARTPIMPSAVSRTGSISKSVTAVLMMILVDQGVISLDDPVEQYFPEIAQLSDPRPGAPPITFRHLASHTAGLIREPQLRDAASGSIEGWSDKILESIPATAFDSVPGARYQYSNIGFGMLGLALERAAGRPFMDMVQDEIFTPLGMTGSTFVVEDAGLEDRVPVGYANGRDGSINTEGPANEHAGRGYKVPNGGVYSSVADLARFAGALSGVPGLLILEDDSRREMLSIQTPEDPAQGYGLGFSVQENSDGSRTVGHGGSVAGYTAALQFDPDARITVVLLRNYNSGATNLGGLAAELVRELRR